MKRRLGSLAFLLWFAGCTTLPVRLSGIVPPVAWSTRDFNHSSGRTFDGDTEQFTFTLVLQETQGHPLTFTTLTWEVWQNGVDRSGRQVHTGAWALPAQGTLRQPVVYTIYCPPATLCPEVGPTTQWDMTFEGHDARGQPIRIALQPELPWIPPRSVSDPALDPQGRTGVVLPSIHIRIPRLYYPLAAQ
jgi:hypothetical protein